MHDLLVVIITIAGLATVLFVTSSLFDALELRAAEKRVGLLNGFVERRDHELDYVTIALITAELRYRMSMTGEFYITVEHRLLLNRIAHIIYILAKAGVRNQLDMLMVVAEQINRDSHCTARVNFTTNNRLELVTQMPESEQLVYIKFHSVNTLF